MAALARLPELESSILTLSNEPCTGAAGARRPRAARTTKSIEASIDDADLLKAATRDHVIMQALYSNNSTTPSKAAGTAGAACLRFVGVGYSDSEKKLKLEVVRCWHQYNEILGNALGLKGEIGLWGLSHQFLFDLECQIEGFLGLLDDLIAEHGTVAIRPRPALMNDTLESTFGCIRYNVGGGGKCSIFKVVHGSRTVEMQGDARRVTRQRLRSRRNVELPAAAPQPSKKRGRWRTSLGSQEGCGEVWNLVEPPQFDAQWHVVVHDAQRGVMQHPVPVSWQTMQIIQAWDDANNARDGKWFWWLTHQHLHRSSLDRMNVALARAMLSVDTARMLRLLREKYGGKKY